MSNVYDLMIQSLVDDDKKVVITMNKKQLIEYNLSLQSDLYRELPNESIVEMYEERFNTIVKGVR
jgi:hypothetical protein